MKKPLLFGLIAAIALGLVYLLFRPKQLAGTGGLSVTGRTPIVPQGNPLFSWSPIPGTGVVSGNPVPLSPSTGIMPPSTITPFKVASSPAPTTNPTFGGAATQNPSNVNISDSGITYNGVQVGSGPTDIGSASVPSVVGYEGSDYGYAEAADFSF